MILDILLMSLVTLFGFDESRPKYDLHKKEDTFKLNEGMIILILFVLGCVFFISIFFLIGSGTESGIYYNSNLY